jgi:hypothetical protein
MKLIRNRLVCSLGRNRLDARSATAAKMKASSSVPDGGCGASVIQCCYAAIESCESSILINKAESKNTTVTFCSTKKCIVEEKISLNVSRPEVNPACIAGVLTARPNLSAL